LYGLDINVVDFFKTKNYNTEVHAVYESFLLKVRLLEKWMKYRKIILAIQ
jgi:hypothetical protein